MTVKELINIVEKDAMCSLWEFEECYVDNISVKRVASGLEEDEHRWYSTAVNVYQCEDGFVGVRGAYKSFSEQQSWQDIGETCTASEYEEVQTVSYKLKTT